MRTLSSLQSSLTLSCLLLAGIGLPSIAVAQTVQTDDYLYIGVEAEDHFSKDDRWVTTTPSTPTEENDPDGNHSDQAGGSTYLELLPDMRVTHADEFGPPTAFWGAGGQGPLAKYAVEFPEPGRYYVHVRAYSTGTEDNGMHIGLNDNWPASGQRIQFCSSHRRAWWWSSAQRDSGGNGSCGMEKTIWLDVPTAGTHTVIISPREDGFEIDRFVLLKDLSGNTRVCEPTTLTGVSCRNGSIETPDGFVDMRVILSAEAVDADPDVEAPNPTEVEIDSNIKLTAKLENLDSFDTANDIVVTLSPVAGDWEMVSMDDRCTENGDEFECTLESLHPTAPDENELFVFTMKALQGGDKRIDASVVSSDMDDMPSNDVAATVVRVNGGAEPVVEDTDVLLVMDTDNVDYETGAVVELAVVLDNLGSFAAKEVAFTLEVPAGLTTLEDSLPAACSLAANVECVFDVIETAGSESFSISFNAATAGNYSLSANVAASNDIDASNNQDTDTLSVSDPVVVVVEELPDVDGETDDNLSAENGGNGSVNVDTSVNIDSNNTDVPTAVIDGNAPAETNDTSDSGSMAYWFVLAMMLFCSARLYGWHQREMVAVRK